MMRVAYCSVKESLSSLRDLTCLPKSARKASAASTLLTVTLWLRRKSGASAASCVRRSYGHEAGLEQALQVLPLVVLEVDRGRVDQVAEERLEAADGLEDRVGDRSQACSAARTGNGHDELLVDAAGHQVHQLLLAEA